MSDAPGQEASQPKRGRKLGDKGTKKLHAAANDKVATTDAFDDATSLTRKAQPPQYPSSTLGIVLL